MAIDGNKDIMNVAGAVIGIFLILILAFLAWALVFIIVPKENETALSIVLGILSSQVGIVIGFYFGSSFSNKKQQETIGTLAETAKSAQAALPNTVEPTVIKAGESVTVLADEEP